MYEAYSMLSENKTEIPHVLLTFIRLLSRLNRDFNPLIRRREEAAFGKDFVEPCIEKGTSEYKIVVFLLGASFTFAVLAFFKCKNKNRFSVGDSKQDKNAIYPSAEDKTLEIEFLEDLFQKLIRLHSLLSIIARQNNSKSWLNNFSTIPTCNFIQKLRKSNSIDSTRQRRYLTNRKYWNEVEIGLKESLKALKTTMVSAHTSFTADKSTQVNEESCSELFNGRTRVDDTSIKLQSPVQGSRFCYNCVSREQENLELLADRKRLMMEEAIHRAEIPLIESPRSTLDGNTLNIQIEFDRRVLLGELAN